MAHEGQSQPLESIHHPLMPLGSPGGLLAPSILGAFGLVGSLQPPRIRFFWPRPLIHSFGLWRHGAPFRPCVRLNSPTHSSTRPNHTHSRISCAPPSQEGAPVDQAGLLLFVYPLLPSSAACLRRPWCLRPFQAAKPPTVDRRFLPVALRTAAAAAAAPCATCRAAATVAWLPRPAPGGMKSTYT